MEQGNFERSWSEAFEGAEVAPSNSVWTNVELGLEKAAGGQMKQRLLFYKLLAAASVVFALGIAGTYYMLSSMKENPSMLADENTTATAKSNEPTGSISPEVKTIEKDRSIVDATNKGVRTSETNVKNSFSTNSKNSLLANTTTETISTNTIKSASGDNISALIAVVKDDQSKVVPNANWFRTPKATLVNLKKPMLIIPSVESTADPGMLLLAKLKDEEKLYEDSKNKTSVEKLWTSVGFAAGSYNPNSGNTAILKSGVLGNSYSTNTNSPSSGSSYALSVQLGAKIADRLILLGGVSYITQNASYTSNTGSLESTGLRASLNDYAFTVDNQSVAISPYGVNSNLQYVSLPVQAGYVVVDRKFAVQLNGGVSTDFFLLNTLTPEIDNVSKVSQGPGDDSPYRSVIFSGLVGTEFSYRITDRYRVALNPGMRYALNSIYKADVPTEVSPVTFDVGLRFRYIFR